MAFGQRGGSFVGQRVQRFNDFFAARCVLVALFTQRVEMRFRGRVRLFADRVELVPFGLRCAAVFLVKRFPFFLNGANFFGEHIRRLRQILQRFRLRHQTIARLPVAPFEPALQALHFAVELVQTLLFELGETLCRKLLEQLGRGIARSAHVASRDDFSELSERIVRGS